MHLNPAALVIKKFGGVRPLARLLGKDPSTVWKWRATVKRHGTGGLIPAKSQREVLLLAQRLQLGITSDDIIFGRDV